MNSYLYFITRKFITKNNKINIKKHPQVVCFAFDLITLQIHLNGQFEHDELMMLDLNVFPHVDKNSTCLDIGANIGNHTLHFAKHFSKVIAFEPHPRTYKLLSINADLFPNIVALNIGASDAEKTLYADENQGNIGATAINRELKVTTASIPMKLNKIDDMAEITSAGNISFIKIDVEGHELEALSGAKNTLQKYQPIIALEVLSSEINNNSAKSIEYLKSLGYSYFYEPVVSKGISKLPRPVMKIYKALYALVTFKRFPPALKLSQINALEHRDYKMIICACKPVL